MKLQTKKKIAGFTLIELLIAMTVTLVILYAAVLAFQNASNSNQIVTQSADMTDNLRAGLNLIQQDLQQAGAGIPVGGISIPFTPNSTTGCGTTAAINRPILGGHTTFPPCNATMPAVEPGNSLGPALTAPDATAGTASNPDPSGITDEITVLYEDNTLKLDSLPVYAAATGSSPGCPNGSVVVSNTTVTITFDPTCINLSTAGIQVQIGDLILLSNPNGNTLLCVTGVSTASNSLTFTGGDAFGLNGRNKTDTSGTIAQMANSGCTSGANSCFPSVLATRVWMVTYYLDNVTSPPWVRLVRQINMPVVGSTTIDQPTPVGETLENLQFTYNFVDGITNPSNQVTVPTGNSESQIRSVNVYLAARSNYNLNKGTSTSYARNNLMTQVSLRSMAYVDRYF
jgi:prepilin-type N-terminal cleavage/methylation domain-containing protein